jgi:hypothetical protein
MLVKNILPAAGKMSIPPCKGRFETSVRRLEPSGVEVRTWLEMEARARSGTLLPMPMSRT